MLLRLKAFIASNYSVPEDPEKRLFDFYATLLILARKTDLLDLNVRNFIEQANGKLIESLYKEFTSTLQYAIFYNAATDLKTYYEQDPEYFKGFPEVESSIENLTRRKVSFPKTNQEVQTYLQDTRAANRELAQKYQEIFGSKSLPLAKKIFKLGLGKDEDPWLVQIIPAYEQLLEARSPQQKVIAIDHVYDVEHHNGTVFAWFAGYDKDGYDWLIQALEIKSKLKDGFEIVDKVSASLRPYYLKALKSQLNRSLDSFKEDKPVGLKKFDKTQEHQTLNGWYEFPNGLRAEFKDAEVKSSDGYFQSEWVGLTLLSGSFIGGDWPGGYVNGEWLSRKTVKPPLKVEKSQS